MSEDGRLPVFFGSDYRRAAFTSSGDVIVTGLPAVAIVAGKTLVVAPIEFAPRLVRSNLLVHFVLVVAKCRTA